MSEEKLVPVESLGAESPPALVEELGFLPVWKRSVYGAGGLASLWGAWMLGQLLVAPGASARPLVLAQGLCMVGLLVGMGFYCARVAREGVVEVAVPTRGSQVGLALVLVLVAAFAWSSGEWVGAAALLVALYGGLRDLERLRRGSLEFGDGEPRSLPGD